MWHNSWDENVDAEPAAESVLVGIVPSLPDWEIICTEHWYRIPVARAPRRIGVEYVAFYHPKCFGELRWTISTYAPVRRYRIVTRRELLPEAPDHPRANELYYKLDLGPLEKLPRPIPSQKLRRISFILTDLSSLLQAREINDLWQREATNERLWRALNLSEGPPPNYLIQAA